MLYLLIRVSVNLLMYRNISADAVFVIFLWRSFPAQPINIRGRDITYKFLKIRKGRNLSLITIRPGNHKHKICSYFPRLFS